MAIRWRKTGELLCAAMTEPREDDTYIDDRLHYRIAVELQVVIADPDHQSNSLWHWAKPPREEPTDATLPPPAVPSPPPFP